VQQRIKQVIIGVFLFFLGSSLQAEVNWIPTFKEAREIAARENKFIVVDVSASWCGPCRKMAREVYPDPEFITFTEGNVFMLVDAYIDKEGRLLAQQFDVQSFPAILVLNSDGEEIDRLSGGRDTKALIKDLQYLFDNPIPSKELFSQVRNLFDISISAV
jgi:thioredoxin-related protein